MSGLTGFLKGKCPVSLLFFPLNHVRLFCDLMTVAFQASLSMGFSRQEYYCGLPFPSLGDLPDPGIEPASLVLADGFFTTEPPRKPPSKFGLHQMGLIL